MTKRLEWTNLKDDYCPSCYKDLDNDEKSLIIKCSSCDFVITRVKYNDLIEQMEKEEAGDDAENA